MSQPWMGKQLCGQVLHCFYSVRIRSGSVDKCNVSIECACFNALCEFVLTVYKLMIML